MKKEFLASDVLASFVVFLVALPLCMGIAIASGVAPAQGLITGIVGGLLVGFLAGSPLQASGPAAGLAVIVYEIVQKRGIEMLGPIVLAAGLLQFAAGSLKWGQYFRAVSPPVVYAMLAGIGILIFAGQFHVMIDDAPRANGVQNLLAIPAAIHKAAVPAPGAFHPLAGLTGVVTILSMFVWANFRPALLAAVPAEMIAILAGTAFATAARFPIRHIDVPGNLLDAAVLPAPGAVYRLAEPAVMGTVLALAMIASAETLLSAVAVDRMHDGVRTDFDREIKAQGIGNVVCGLLGALPMTGVIVRSSANVLAGGKTRLATMLHGFWLLAFVVSMPAVLRLIPTACLAALLVYTGIKLVNLDHIRELAKFGRVPVIIYAVTVITIVMTDLLTGVVTGVVLSIARLVYSLTHADIALNQTVGCSRAELVLSGSLTFFSLPRLARHLDALPAGTELHVLIRDLRHIDHACLDTLQAWQNQHAKAGSRMVVEWESLLERHHSAAARPVPRAD